MQGFDRSLFQRGGGIETIPNGCTIQIMAQNIIQKGEAHHDEQRTPDCT